MKRYFDRTGLRRTAVNLSLMLASTIIFLVLIEIGFRVLAKRHHHQVRYPEVTRFYLPEKFNGSRERFYSPQKPAGTYRIIVVGDSFTFGPRMQFDDTFPKRLERLLNLNENQPKVEVINYGVPGASTAVEARLVKHALKYFDPDLILLEVTLNDPELKDYHQTHPEVGKFGQLRLEHPIFRHWKSLAFFVTRLYNLRSHQQYIKYFEDLFDQPETWENFAGSASLIQKMAEVRNVKIAAVVFPLFFRSLGDDYPFVRIHRKINEYFQTLGVPLLDLLPAFRNMEPEKLQEMADLDPHPNEIAARVAADEIYEWLKKNKWIPPEAIVKRVKRKRSTPKLYLPVPNGTVPTPVGVALTPLEPAAH